MSESEDSDDFLSADEGEFETGEMVSSNEKAASSERKEVPAEHTSEHKEVPAENSSDPKNISAESFIQSESKADEVVLDSISENQKETYEGSRKEAILTGRSEADADSIEAEQKETNVHNQSATTDVGQDAIFSKGDHENTICSATDEKNESNCEVDIKEDNSGNDVETSEGVADYNGKEDEEKLSGESDRSNDEMTASKQSEELENVEMSHSKSDKHEDKPNDSELVDPSVEKRLESVDEGKGKSNESMEKSTDVKDETECCKALETSEDLISENKVEVDNEKAVESNEGIEKIGSIKDEGECSNVKKNTKPEDILEDKLDPKIDEVSEAKERCNEKSSDGHNNGSESNKISKPDEVLENKRTSNGDGKKQNSETKVHCTGVSGVYKCENESDSPGKNHTSSGVDKCEDERDSPGKSHTSSDDATGWDDFPEDTVGSADEGGTGSADEGGSGWNESGWDDAGWSDNWSKDSASASKASDWSKSEPMEKSPAKSKTVENTDMKDVKSALDRLAFGAKKAEPASTPRDVFDRLSNAAESKSTTKSDDSTHSVFDRLSNAADKKQSESSGGSSWGWGSWGSSILNTASNSISTLGSNLGEGLNVVMETVESNLGAPDPHHLVQQDKKRDEQQRSKGGNLQTKQPQRSTQPEEKPTVDPSTDGWGDDWGDAADDAGDDEGTGEGTGEETSGDGGWGTEDWGAAWFNDVTKNIEQKGKSLVHGGIDVLETIGKKTMDVIKEGDPGFEKTKLLLMNRSGPNLSKALREAKEREQTTVTDDNVPMPVTFTSVFDEHQGLVQLEALEMTSSQCQGRVRSVALRASDEEQENLRQIKQILTPADDDEEEDEPAADFEFSSSLKAALADTGLNGPAIAKLLETSVKTRELLNSCTSEQADGIHKDPQELFEDYLTSLATHTALAVTHLHKTALKYLTSEVDPHTAADDMIKTARDISKFTRVLCHETSWLAQEFTTCLNTAADDSENPDSVIALVTNVYLESSNSCTYIRDAASLLVPVLQQRTFTDTL